MRSPTVVEGRTFVRLRVWSLVSCFTRIVRGTEEGDQLEEEGGRERGGRREEEEKEEKVREERGGGVRKEEVEAGRNAGRNAGRKEERKKGRKQSRGKNRNAQALSSGLNPRPAKRKDRGNL